MNTSDFRRTTTFIESYTSSIFPATESALSSFHCRASNRNRKVRFLGTKYRPSISSCPDFIGRPPSS
jgi:hypothetical protein